MNKFERVYSVEEGAMASSHMGTPCSVGRQTRLKNYLPKNYVSGGGGLQMTHEYIKLSGYVKTTHFHFFRHSGPLRFCALQSALRVKFFGCFPIILLIL